MSSSPVCILLVFMTGNGTQVHGIRHPLLGSGAPGFIMGRVNHFFLGPGASSGLDGIGITGAAKGVL